jgi:maltose alpha-D-glucosyltransferase / alpha-amylase
MASEKFDNTVLIRLREALPRVLPGFLNRQRWFGGKARTIVATEVVDTIPVPTSRELGFVLLTRVSYSEGRTDIYALPLVLEREKHGAGEEVHETVPRLRVEGQPGEEVRVCHDALWDKDFCELMLGAIHAGGSFLGAQGKILASPTKMFLGIPDPARSGLDNSVMKGEQSNTSIRFGDRFIMKFYRRLEEGINPDLEIGAFLTDKAMFKHTPPLAGALEYRKPRVHPATLAILQAFVPNQGDAWRYTLGTLGSYFENAVSRMGVAPPPGLPPRSLFELGGIKASPETPEAIGTYWDSASLLGRRTAELHVALASDSEDPSFRPEPYSSAFQQSQYRSMLGLTDQVLRTLEKRIETLSAPVQTPAKSILNREQELLNRFKSFAQRPLTGELIRIHGDYHLGQILYTGSDFVIIDFEGEPARPLAERRAKRCPLQDVAGMLRSFHYAAYTALSQRDSGAIGDREESANLEAWARYWQAWVSARFLGEYLEVARQAQFLPGTEKEFSILLNAHLLEKAVYELGYELNNRPDWVKLPLQGILNLLESTE